MFAAVAHRSGALLDNLSALLTGGVSHDEIAPADLMTLVPRLKRRVRVVSPAADLDTFRDRCISESVVPTVVYQQRRRALHRCARPPDRDLGVAAIALGHFTPNPCTLLRR